MCSDESVTQLSLPKLSLKLA